VLKLLLPALLVSLGVSVGYSQNLSGVDENVVQAIEAYVESQRAFTPIAKAIRNKGFQDPMRRQEVASLLAARDKSAALARSNLKQALLAANITVEEKTSAGTWELAGVNENNLQPLIRITHDKNAAISSDSWDVNIIEGLPGNVTVGVWDAGAPLSTHREFAGRVSVLDGAAVDGHATRVAGVIAASGVTTNSRGIAPEAQIKAFDWHSDNQEMADNAAATATATNKIPVSNHSYSFSTGWYRSGGVFVYVGDSEFGKYNSSAAEVDALIKNAAYYTVIRSAGNDRQDNPTNGNTVRLNYWSSATTTYNSAIHPPGDSQRFGGYNTISHEAVSKNVITVGAVGDAVNGSERALHLAVMTQFSAWGPTDDGRIKPDLVANGLGLYTTAEGNNSAYTSLFSGTSASAPVIAGICAVLTESLTQGTSNKAVKNSTLKALLIHGADDLEEAGPDYKVGWGLANTRSSLAVVFGSRNQNATHHILEEELANGAKNIHEFTATAGTPVKVTINWTDPAGNAISTDKSRASNLVNNLDIKVVGPNQEAFLPFVMPFVGQWTQESMALPATKGINNTDNVEMITFTAPTTGTYALEISHQGTLISTQEYSLIVSGMTVYEEPDEPGIREEYESWASSQFGPNWNELPNTAPNDDFDADGLANWAEFHLGTSAFSGLSTLECEIINVAEEAGADNSRTVTIRVSPLTESGDLEILQSNSLEATSWSTTDIILPKIKASHGEGQIQTSHPSLFLRARYTPPVFIPW